GVLNTLVGGTPALDIQRLNIRGLDEAHHFVKAYGYDLSSEKDLDLLWRYYRRAVNYIRTHLLQDGEEIPEMLADPNQLKNLAYLLIYASTREVKQNSVQNWACAILRVMHVLVHLENDLFFQFSSDIQEQILEPFKREIYKDPVSGIWLGGPSEPGRIRLEKFVVKSFKSSDSSVNKLLAKPSAVAFTILDKLGVRFVTRHLFDVFRVLRFLEQKNLVSFPHGISDESNNTIYPLELFLETMESFTKDRNYTLEEIDQKLHEKLLQAGEGAHYLKKLNIFSSGDYRFLKFITRRLIHVEIPGVEKSRRLNFFYPYEVQIMDYETYTQNLSGPSSHEQYKLRQKKFARRRIMGFLDRNEEQGSGQSR
ncbi:MAG: TIGR04552 family protein, partial [Bdellovibrionales bacterium]|nr:TIGR04552 family protein [Bdellovibrionales bacterium]